MGIKGEGGSRMSPRLWAREEVVIVVSSMVSDMVQVLLRVDLVSMRRSSVCHS